MVDSYQKKYGLNPYSNLKVVHWYLYTKRLSELRKFYALRDPVDERDYRSSSRTLEDLDKVMAKNPIHLSVIYDEWANELDETPKNSSIIAGKNILPGFKK